MKTEDHRALAYYWQDQIDSKGLLPRRYWKAFVLGNIEPDKNIFTYFHGLFREKKLSGHNFENSLPCIKKLLKRLENKKKMGWREFYLLGKTIHYIADSFTFPHNLSFQGNLRAHCDYERRLHLKIKERLSKKFFDYDRCTERKGEELFQLFLRFHQRYGKAVKCLQTDCDYILMITGLVVSSFIGIDIDLRSRTHKTFIY